MWVNILPCGTRSIRAICLISPVRCFGPFLLSCLRLFWIHPRFPCHSYVQCSYRGSQRHIPLHHPPVSFVLVQRLIVRRSLLLCLSLSLSILPEYRRSPVPHRMFRGPCFVSCPHLACRRACSVRMHVYPTPQVTSVGYVRQRPRGPPVRRSPNPQCGVLISAFILRLSNGFPKFHAVFRLPRSFPSAPLRTVRTSHATSTPTPADRKHLPDLLDC
ncbi:hypothetical protein FB451DRAFT_396596 [Mycena latifolia]|nr:hypothetical protein FB451DRAFT_396596 [Mycena latifolia]